MGQNGVAERTRGVKMEEVVAHAAPARTWRGLVHKAWYNLDFWLGVLTTLLVFTAWSTNLVSKPLATAFGGSFTALGMGVAFMNYSRHKKKGRLPVITLGIEGRLPGAVLAVLTAKNGHNDMVIRSALRNAEGKPVVFLYVGEPKTTRVPRMFEVIDPYLEDAQAKEYLGKAEQMASKTKVARRFLYRQEEPGVVSGVWQLLHPHDTIVSAEQANEVKDVNPDRVRYELMPEGKVAHLLKRWS